MKNKLVWTINILIVALIGFWLWCQRPGLPVENVLLPKALLYGRLKNVKEHMNQLVQSDFGKNISVINLPDVLNRNNFSAKDVDDFQQWQKNFIKYSDNFWIKQLLAREVAVSFYRRDDAYHFFIVLRLTPLTRMAELLLQLTRQWDGIYITNHENYRGRGINEILIANWGLKAYYLRVRDLMIISPSSSQDLREVVDVTQKRQTSLRDDPAFKFVSDNSYPKGDGLLFVNLNYFSDLWRGLMDSRLTSLGYQTAAFPVYGLSYLPGDVSKYKLIVGLDEKYMPSAMRQVFNCPALSNDTLKLVPVDAIAYHWGGCYNFQRSWDMARNALEGNPDVADEIIGLKRRLEHHFGIDIKEDVLPLIGHEMGGYLTDLDMQGSYPFPRMLVFVKIQNRASAESLLEHLTQNTGTEIKSEEYNQVKIHYITLPWGANMDPGYGFLGDYLLMATSRQLIKMSIDAYSDSMRSMVSDDVIGQFKLDGEAKFHSVTLMKTSELSRRAEDFLGWIDKYLSGQVTMAAAYKQDGDNKKEQLDEAIADKSAELLLAQKKLNQLKNAPVSGALLDDPDLVSGAIANLNREEQSIRDDIADYNQQKDHLTRVLDSYALGAQSAKLTMYNMENLVSPVLKGLESIDAQAVTVRFGDKLLETEFQVK